MAKWEDIDEVRAIFAALYQPMIAAGTPGTAETALYAQELGALIARQETLFGDGTLSAAVAMTVTKARLAGATLAQFKAIRDAALSEAWKGDSAKALAQRIVLLVLAQEARIISEMTFRSRSEANAVADAMRIAFDDAAEAASDGKDAAVYMAILSLQASLTKHLADLGRLLPRIVPFKFPVNMPSLTMSQRVYQTGDRADELVAENAVRHPLFMPLTGKMLSN